MIAVIVRTNSSSTEIFSSSSNTPRHNDYKNNTSSNVGLDIKQ